MSWHILVPDAHWFELVVRALVVYCFLLIALRLFGRRELAQLTSFDLVLLLILANALQNSINAGDNSLGGGLISAFTLLVINWLVGFLTYRVRWFERLVQGLPIVIVKDGRVQGRALRREQITLEELRSALRKQGIEGIRECQRVVLESDGTFTAVRKGVEQAPRSELVDESTP